MGWDGMGWKTNLSQIVSTCSSSDGDLLRSVRVVFGVGEVDGEFLSKLTRKREVEFKECLEELHKGESGRTRMFTR